jgi:hypothetical protein
MVPRQHFHQLKPNSGAANGTYACRRKEIACEADFDAQKNRIQLMMEKSSA